MIGCLKKWHKFVCLMRHRVFCLVVNNRIGDKQTARLFAICLSPIALRHVLKIPRKGSIVVPCFALCCLFAFIWHLSLTLSVA